MIYICMFFISSFLVYCSERYRKNKILLYIGLFLPILLAVLRSEVVGNDIRGYVKPLYLVAKRSDSIIDFYNKYKINYTTRELELGFSIVGYLGTRIFGNLNGVFLVYETINIVVLYYAYKFYNRACCSRGEKAIAFWLVLFSYLLQFYNMSLTMMRQSLACIIVLLAISFLINGYYKRCAVAFIIATLFHSTALFAVTFAGLYWIIKTKKEDYLK